MNNAFFIGLVSWSDDGPFFFSFLVLLNSISHPALFRFYLTFGQRRFYFLFFSICLIIFSFFLSSFVIIPFLLASIRRTPGLLFSQPALKKKERRHYRLLGHTQISKIPAVAWLTPIMPRPLVINHPLSYFCVLYVANVCPFLFSYVSLLVSYHLSYLRLALVFALHQKATFSLLFLSFFLFSLDWKNMISLYK